MDSLQEYFGKASGTGVLATADSAGRVDAAVYSKPYFPDEEHVAFIMAETRTYDNIEANPFAVYLFTESAEENKGRRLYLKKVKEERDSKQINEVMKKVYPPGEHKYQSQAKSLVFFKVDEVRPLLGDKLM